MSGLSFKHISLEDKKLFDGFFCNFHPEISEYTFTNLFIWRKSRSIEYALHDDGLIILAGGDKGKYFLPPVGFHDKKKIIEYLLEYGLKHNITAGIKRLDESFAESLEGSGLKIAEDPDNFDYVYNTDDLAFLKGRKYSNKRGFVKKFSAEYYHKYWKATKKCVPNALKLAEKWLESRDRGDNSVLNEFEAIRELFEHYDVLNVKGGVICSEDKVIAFEFGERLNKDTFVIHFEKADPVYAGIYQAINKMFVENEIEGRFKFVNREQDLGIPGIRQAKQSYYPAKMIKKFTVTA